MLIKRKFRLYERQGIREYWIIDASARYVHVYALKGGRYREPAMYSAGDIVKSAIFPGLAVSGDSLFDF